MTDVMHLKLSCMGEASRTEDRQRQKGFGTSATASVISAEDCDSRASDPLSSQCPYR